METSELLDDKTEYEKLASFRPQGGDGEFFDLRSKRGADPFTIDASTESDIVSPKQNRLRYFQNTSKKDFTFDDLDTPRDSIDGSSEVLLAIKKFRTKEFNSEDLDSIYTGRKHKGGFKYRSALKKTANGSVSALFSFKKYLKANGSVSALFSFKKLFKSEKNTRVTPARSEDIFLDSINGEVPCKKIAIMKMNVELSSSFHDVFKSDHKSGKVSSAYSNPWKYGELIAVSEFEDQVRAIKLPKKPKTLTSKMTTEN
eukprot:CAMPEP_0114990696 /NCGR_PEP_ID=MMETSP0216-20121206/10950_1 /TAXON_ID=223996 /ORGANISM="Protocruzia adherens, Strain Boccale" /LENGTH=256 /DNA_ID=CAMNT_0002353921 /DNA_START=39 /DNA_END=810 /DNA_ORIENTATION=-